MNPGRFLSEMRGTLTAGDIIDEVVYLGPVWRQQHYGRLLRFLEDQIGLVPDQDLFAFGYDWRIGVASAAAQLGTYIRRLTARQGNEQKRIVLIAHSRGGLVARSYVGQPTGGAPSKLILLGAPNYGSSEALACLLDNWTFGPRITRLLTTRIPKLRRMIGELVYDFQSIYDLLPQPAGSGHGAGVVLADGSPRDLYSDPWLGSSARSARLTTAQQVHARLGSVSSVPTTMIYGTGHKTTMYIRQSTLQRPWWRGFRRANSNDGDGVVPVPSAAPPGVTRVAPYSVAHGDLYAHGDIQELIRRELEECSDHASIRDAHPDHMSVRMSIPKAAQANGGMYWSGEDLSLTMVLSDPSGDPVDNASMAWEGPEYVDVAPVSTRPGVYRVRVRLPREAGDVQFRARFGAGSLSGEATSVLPVISEDELTEIRQEIQRAMPDDEPGALSDLALRAIDSLLEGVESQGVV
jgi:hypothetical protein